MLAALATSLTTDHMQRCAPFGFVGVRCASTYYKSMLKHVVAPIVLAVAQVARLPVQVQTPQRSRSVHQPALEPQTYEVRADLRSPSIGASNFVFKVKSSPCIVFMCIYCRLHRIIIHTHAWPRPLRSRWRNFLHVQALVFLIA